MGAFTFFVDGILPYVTLAVFVIGPVWRLWSWFRVPLPMRVGLPPAPKTTAGWIWHIGIDVSFMPNLYDSDRTLWFLINALRGLLGIHFLTIVLGALALWLQVDILGPILVVFGLSGLGVIIIAYTTLLRRLFKVEIRRLTAFTDHLSLGWIWAVALLGLFVAFLAPPDGAALVQWMEGLVTFAPVSVESLAFSIYSLFMQILVIYMPFSKFSPLGHIATGMITRKEELLHPEGVLVK